MKYRIEYSPRFTKNFARLDPLSQQAIRKAVKLTSQDPRHPSLRTWRVQGTDSVFEASANMDIRITWEYVNDAAILLRKPNMLKSGGKKRSPTERSGHTVRMSKTLDGVNCPVQYGDGFSAWTVYLSAYQL